MDKRNTLKLVWVLTVVAVLASFVVICGAAPAPQPPAAVLDFWKGKIVNLIVPHGAGGGNDMYARLLASYMAKLLGCTIVVDNITGAGGEIGRNKVYNAKPDGLTIGFSSATAMVYAQASGSEGVQYDIAKMKWLARVLDEPDVIVVPPKGKYQSGADLTKATDRVKFSVSGVGADDFFTLAIVATALKIKLNAVTGYKGTKEASLAVITGEVDAFEASLGTIMPVIKQGDVKPVMVLSHERLPELPGVPTVFEVGKDIPDAADLLAVPISLTEVARVFFAPPDLPKEKYDALEWVLQKVMNDPDMLAKANAAKRPITYAPGTEVTQAVQAAAAKVKTIKPILVEALKAAQ
jgi:tripartite-type tricarboxylate transporter receptor subunit TctC